MYSVAFRLSDCTWNPGSNKYCLHYIGFHLSKPKDWNWILISLFVNWKEEEIFIFELIWNKRFSKKNLKAIIVLKINWNHVGPNDSWMLMTPSQIVTGLKYSSLNYGLKES